MRQPPTKATIEHAVLRHFCNQAKINYDPIDNDKERAVFAHQFLAPKLSKSDVEQLFLFFTTLLASGWEDSGGSDVTDGGKWTGSTVSGTGSLAVSDVDPHHGTYHLSASVEANGDNAYVRKTITSSAIAYARAYIKFNSINLVSAKKIDLLNLDYGNWPYGAIVAIRENFSANKWCLIVIENSVFTYDYGSAPSTGFYYCVELERDVTNDIQSLLVDDVEEASQAVAITNNTTRVLAGLAANAAGSNSISLDCVVAADAPIGKEEEEALGGAVSKKLLVLNL